MLKPAVMGLVRHGLTTLCGLLVARGIIDTGMAETLIGAGLGIAGVAWSVVAKRTA